MRRSGSIASLVFLLWLCACGGGPAGPPPPQFTLASGDWEIFLLKHSTPSDVVVSGGFLTQNGAAISGTLHMLNDPGCVDGFVDDLVVTGTVSGTTATLSSAPLRGQVLSLSLHPSSNQSGNVVALEGSGNFTGSCGFSADAKASLIPPMNGTFKGTFASGLTGDVTANLSQPDSDAHGYFHVSGDFSFSGSPCFTSATITDSIGFGGLAIIHLNTSDSIRVDLVVVHVVVPTVPDEISAVFILESGPCVNQSGSVILKKQ